MKTALADDHDQCVAFLDANMVRFPSKRILGWWLPAHNFGIRLQNNRELGTWEFQCRDKGHAYFPAGKDPQRTPASILLNFRWAEEPWRKGLLATVNSAQELFQEARQQPLIGNMLASDLAAIEVFEKVQIPPVLITRLKQQVVKVAAARWDAIDTNRGTSLFIPLDGGKPVPAASYKAPRYAAQQRVAARYLRRNSSND